MLWCNISYTDSTPSKHYSLIVEVHSKMFFASGPPSYWQTETAFAIERGIEKFLTLCEKGFSDRLVDSWKWVILGILRGGGVVIWRPFLGIYYWCPLIWTSSTLRNVLSTFFANWKKGHWNVYFSYRMNLRVSGRWKYVLGRDMHLGRYFLLSFIFGST